MRKEGHVTKKLFNDMGYYIVAPEILIKKYGLNIASLWGKIYLYSLGNKGFCSTSQINLAKDLKISDRSIRAFIKILLDDKLIIDLNPSFPNRPGISRRYKVNLNKLKEMLKAETVSSDAVGNDDTPEEFSDDEEIISETEENVSERAENFSSKYTEYIEYNKEDIDRKSFPVKESEKKKVKIDFYKSEIKKVYDPLHNDDYIRYIKKSEEQGLRHLEEYFDLDDEELLRKLYEFSIDYKKE